MRSWEDRRQTMFVNKWQFVAFIFFFIVLEFQIQRLYYIQENLVGRTRDGVEQKVEEKENHDIPQVWFQPSTRKPLTGVSCRRGYRALGNTDQDVWQDTIIIYNRVPKTGSTSLMGVIYELYKRNNYHVLHVNQTRNAPVFTLADQIRFAHNITRWKQRLPAVYHGHIAHLDFKRLGIKKSPLYINLIRKPLDRLVSYYYFLRFGDTFRPHLRRSRQGNKETFDECVERSHVDCKPEKLWIQIPYFCGQSHHCWIPGNKWALEQAKRNLVNNYFVVGVTEELEDFVAVLEASLPRFFKGATEYFSLGGKSHLRKTNTKQAPSQATIEHFKQTRAWQLENEFYQFAHKIFQDVRKRTLLKKDGEWKAAPKKFFYEKVKPRLLAQ